MISSIRRIDSNTFSVGSPAARLDVRRLGGEVAARGVDPLPRGLERGRHRLLGEPVDLQAGHAGAQLARDRHVAAHVAEPDRGGQGQRAAGAVGRPRQAPLRAARGAGTPRANASISTLTFTGSRAVGAWPDPSSTTSSPPVSSAMRYPRSSGVMRSWSPWIASTGQRTPPTSASACSRVIPAAGESIVCSSTTHPASRPQPTQSSTGFSEWGSGEHLADEVLHEAREVPAPGRAREARPALVAARVLLKGELVPPRVVGRERRHGRGERDHPGDALRAQRGDDQRGRGAQRQPGDHGALGRGRVEHRQRVEHVAAVERGILRAIRAAAAARVERDHAEAPRQVRDLELPEVRGDERPRGRQQERADAGAEDLVADADPVDLDRVLNLRLERAHRASILKAWC